MKVRDPVCGKEIDLVDAMASEDRDGWAYFFCSSACHRLFNLSPERFSDRPETAPADAGQARRVRCEDN